MNMYAAVNDDLFSSLIENLNSFFLSKYDLWRARIVRAELKSLEIGSAISYDL